jgi:hypothetical protein
VLVRMDVRVHPLGQQLQVCGQLSDGKDRRARLFCTYYAGTKGHQIQCDYYKHMHAIRLCNDVDEIVALPR